jgi:hypothetical protein
MKINPVYVAVAPGLQAARPLPYTVSPLKLPPEVLARLSSSPGLVEATTRSGAATLEPATIPAKSGSTPPGSSGLGLLAGYSFPVWQPTVLPGSVLGQFPRNPKSLKPILVMPPAVPAVSEPPKYLPLGNGYWMRPLPAAALANISHTAAISQLAVDGLHASAYTAYLPTEVGPAVDVFSAAVAFAEIYQEIASPKVEGRFKKFLFFSKRLVYLFRGVTVFVPVSPAVEHPLKALGTALKIGDEVAAIQW